MAKGGTLGKSLYTKLLRYGREVDGSPALRNLLLECNAHVDATTQEWVVSGEENIAAGVVHDQGFLVDRVKREFRRVDKLPLSAAFAQLSVLASAKTLYKAIEPCLTPLPAIDDSIPNFATVDHTDLPNAFLLVSHPLAAWSDPLNHSSVTLVFKVTAGSYNGITLNYPYALVGDLSLERTSPHFAELKECPVRVGGFMQKDNAMLSVMCLHTMESEGSFEMLPGVYNTNDLEAVIALRERCKDARLAFFLGYQSWSESYLQGLIQRGHMLAVGLPQNFDLFSFCDLSQDSSNSTLEENHAIKYNEWRRACLGLPGQYKNWALFPQRDTLPEGVVMEYLDKVSCL